jgi:hypothetical protein
MMFGFKAPPELIHLAAMSGANQANRVSSAGRPMLCRVDVRSRCAVLPFPWRRHEPDLVAFCTDLGTSRSMGGCDAVGTPWYRVPEPANLGRDLRSHKRLPCRREKLLHFRSARG